LQMAHGLKRKRVLAITAEMIPAATEPVLAGNMVAERSTPATGSTTPSMGEDEARSVPVTQPLPPHNAAMLNEVCKASEGSKFFIAVFSCRVVYGTTY